MSQICLSAAAYNELIQTDYLEWANGLESTCFIYSSEFLIISMNPDEILVTTNILWAQ